MQESGERVMAEGNNPDAKAAAGAQTKPAAGAQTKPAGLKPGATQAFRRKNIRLGAADYVGKRNYFLTLCFARRLRYGCDAGISRRLIEALPDLSERHRFAVHAYCIMPDHVHVLAEGLSEGSNLLGF